MGADSVNADLFAPLPDKKYGVIYADPPWDYRGQVQHGGKDKPFTSGAKVFYPTVKIEDLKTLPVRELRDPGGCILFLWATGPILEDALDLMEAWGFKYKQVAFVWNKERVNPGAYTMTSCEFVLCGTYIKRPVPLGSRRERQLHAEARTEHSRKPLEVSRRISRMYPSSQKIELFARGNQLGGDWDYWGSEADDC